MHQPIMPHQPGLNTLHPTTMPYQPGVITIHPPIMPNQHVVNTMHPLTVPNQPGGNTMYQTAIPNQHVLNTMHRPTMPYQPGVITMHPPTMHNHYAVNTIHLPTVPNQPGDNPMYQSAIPNQPCVNRMHPPTKQNQHCNSHLYCCQPQHITTTSKMTPCTSTLRPQTARGMFGYQPDQHQMHPPNSIVFYNQQQNSRPTTSQQPRRIHRIPIIDPISGEDITASMTPVTSESGTADWNTSGSFVSCDGVTINYASSHEENEDLAQQSMLLSAIQERSDLERTDYEFAMHLQEMSSESSPSEEEHESSSDDDDSSRWREWREEYGYSSSEDENGIFDFAEQIERVPPGLSDHDFSRLPTKIFNEIEDTQSECSICCQDYETGDAQTTLPCRHEYHPNCIKNWLMERATCPNCRQHVNVI
ncbi:hypothetical protein DPMN_072847 [Dreissena polymorpha]|uniref:RING-type domain-containing protein n=2 Tax=Dreissena polymorpha TaxID=45954 RepID=A0A9D4BY26_DREPO|nr:hypothetical protein DPMN_072847 [Dreissena polymorpha]